jgi:nitroimidazol reductase NimA-like FMN-containing flavoprotein (pyridoxamine 5'-phosphate oxidase superfamily)
VAASVEARTGLELLTRDDCLHLLASSPIGRLAVVVGGQPLIFPVNYALDGEHVVFRTAEGTKLHGALHGRVAFEVDAADTVYHGGWSVLVVGRAEDVADPVERARLDALPLRPWGPGAKDRWVRVHAEAITGRRLPRPIRDLRDRR